MTETRVQHIDAWRFIAIAFVLASHVIHWSHPWYARALPGLGWHLQILGRLGVDVFFCISGFVICRGMVRESEATGTVDLRAFYRRRAYRIVPPFALYLLAVALLNAAGVFDLSAAQFAQSGAFLCNVGAIGACRWPLGHTWSLAYEEQFYLVYPLLFAGLCLVRQRRRVLVLLGALAAACLLASRLPGAGPGAGLGGELNTYLGHFLAMLSGCACALYWERLQPVLARVPLAAWLACAAAIPALCLVAPPPAVTMTVFQLLRPLLICVAVLGTPVHRPAIGRLFTHPLAVHLGRISYTIYLWQQLATAQYGFASPLPALGLLAGVFVLAHLSWRWFEAPLIRLGAARAPARRVSAAPPAGSRADSRPAAAP